MVYPAQDAYAPNGSLRRATFGGIIQVENEYNSWFQPNWLSAKVGVNTIMHYTYQFDLGTANNGNVKEIDNGLAPGRSQVFNYDALNRLVNAQSMGAPRQWEWGKSQVRIFL